MKITIKYEKDEKLEDVEYKATDFFLVVRREQLVQDKKNTKKNYAIPITESVSTNGGNFREVMKEVRQSIIELDKTPNVPPDNT